MKTILYLISLIMLATGCDKRGFLDEKPRQSLVVPTKLEHYQSILDDDRRMNGKGSGPNGTVPNLGEAGADNYYLLPSDFNNLSLQHRNTYIWGKDVYEGGGLNDWDQPYFSIFSCNVVLEGLENLEIKPDEESAYNKAYGSALFFRAHAFYQLAQVFAAPYQKETAASLPGIPLRISSGLQEKLNRATLEETYEKIISDLEKASFLLPTKNEFNTQPTKQAALGLLARVYQTMQNYERALVYADSCLTLHDYLIDYSTIDSTPNYPFSNMENDEVIFSCLMTELTTSPIAATRAKVDTNLYYSYDENDARKQLFFRPVVGGQRFKGSYEGRYYFTGIATDEIILIKAECNARLGMLKEAESALNTLLINRYKKDDTGKSTYVSKKGMTQPEMLRLILWERRKELLFRGLRWTDLRRFNIEGYDITIKRLLEDDEFSLVAQDPKWTWPIPDYVLSFNPLMHQNPR